MRLLRTIHMLLVMAAGLMALMPACAISAQPVVPTYGSAVVSEIIQIHSAGVFRANIKGLPPIAGENIFIVVDNMTPPELWTQDPLSKAFGISALAFTTKMLRDASTIELRNMKRDASFRLRAEVYADSVSLADELIKAGLAKPFVVDDKPRPGASRWERTSIVHISEARARVLLRQITGPTELQVAMEVDCPGRKSRVAETKTLVHGNLIASNTFTEKDRPFVASTADEPIITRACGEASKTSEGWAALGEASGLEILYHPSSIANSPGGQYRRVWVSYGSEGEEGMYYIELDCRERRRRTLDSYDKGGSEPRCPEPPKEEPAWSHVPPASVVDALIRKLCPQNQ